MKNERFEDIEAWQLARELTRKVYTLTKKSRFLKDYVTTDEFQETYDLAGRTRAVIRGFINYLTQYNDHKIVNIKSRTQNLEPRTP